MSVFVRVIERCENDLHTRPTGVRWGDSEPPPDGWVRHGKAVHLFPSPVADLCACNDRSQQQQPGARVPVPVTQDRTSIVAWPLCGVSCGQPETHARRSIRPSVRVIVTERSRVSSDPAISGVRIRGCCCHLLLPHAAVRSFGRLITNHSLPSSAPRRSFSA